MTDDCNDIEDTEEDEFYPMEYQTPGEAIALKVALPPGSLYFVQFQTSKRWKIGFTTGHPSDRLSGALTFTAEPVQLVTHCPVRSVADEQAVHAMLERHRVELPGRREIFEDCPEVRGLVDYVMANQTIDGFEVAMARREAEGKLATLNRVDAEYQRELREVLGAQGGTNAEG